MGIKESALSVIASLTDSDFIRAVTAAGESRKIKATGVGKYAVETYSGSTLAGSAQSVQSAVGGLKNDITTISGDLITLQGDIATLNTNLINKLKKSLIVGTASGSIASFNNGSDIFPALKCVAKIEPNQDLHGYDAPWVGGAGKNKLDIDSVTTSASANWGVSVSGNTLTVEHKNTYSTGLPRTADIALKAGTYCISYTSSIAIVVDVYVNGSWFKAVNTGGTFTLSADSTVYIAFPNTQATTITYQNVQLESGSTPTSYAPYSNICPISGWTGVDVYDDPKHGGIIEWNQQLRELNSTYWKGSSSLTPTNIVFSNNSVSFNPSASGSYVDMYSANYITRLVGHKYLLVAEMYAEGGGEISVLYSKGTGNSQLRTSNSSWTLLGAMWEQTSESKNIQLRCSTYVANMVSHYRNVMLFDLTAMFGSTIADYIYTLEQNNAGAGVAYFKNLFPKDYYAYNAGTETCVSAVNGDPYKKVTVSWSDDAGTVYGGTVDVVSGELTVTHAIKDLGTLTWTYQSGSTRFYAVINDRKLETSDAVKPNMICSAYDCISVNDFNNNNTNGAIRGNTQANTIFLRNTDYTDGATLQAALSGVYLVYELATPQTYQLTAQQVDILLGDNNIFANTGPMDPVEYYADATITIQNLS